MKRKGKPKRHAPPDGREVFKTRLRQETVDKLREYGYGWANRGIEFLVKRYESERPPSEAPQ